MRILYLANLRLPTEKAYGIQIAKMCEAFANIGHEVKLLYPYRKNTGIKQDLFSYYSVRNNFSARRIESKDFYLPGFLDKITFVVKNYFSARILVSEALKENADIYYTRDERIAYILNKKDKNVVFECHRFSSKKKGLYLYFKKIVAISNGLKEDLVKSGVKDGNILMARDGVDLDNFNIAINQVEARKKLYSEFHWEAFARKKIAVYVGHLYLWKGVGVFSETAERLSGINPNYLLFVFGGTNKKDSNILKEELKNIENKLHPNLVPIFYGNFPHQAVPHILKAADCAILTGNESEVISAKYTSPLKMFEYMASGCPIVAQDLPSFREVLNNENSFLVTPGNAKELADKISYIFENEEEAKNKAAKALDDVQNYTWRKRAEKIISYLQN